MSDNTTLNPGTGGDVYASDDIAGIKFQRVKLVHGIDGVNDGDVAATNPFPISVKDTTVGLLSPGNSSTTPLGIGEVFTGVSVDTKDYVTVNVVIKASHASATDGLSLQFSSDGTNWDIIETHTIAAASGQAHLTRAKARYFRVVYTNGGTAQTYFRLATILKNTAVSQTFEKLSIDVDDDHDAALTRAILAAKKPNGDYTNIQGTTAGNLKVSIEEQNGTANLAIETGGNLAAIANATLKASKIVVSGTNIYIGKAAIGSVTSSAVWQVKRIETATDIIIKWADGDALFNNIFDSYISLNYS